MFSLTERPERFRPRQGQRQMLPDLRSPIAQWQRTRKVLVSRSRRYQLQGHRHGTYTGQGVSDGQQDLCYSIGSYER